jgi:hypothetical protein
MHVVDHLLLLLLGRGNIGSSLFNSGFFVECPTFDKILRVIEI